jgi:phosphomannomutase
MGSSRIIFGTDGWRGRIADDYTFDSVRRCTQGFATYLQSLDDASGPVIVGYDRRFASEDFAIAATEVLAGNGYQVRLTNAPTPTPVISYSVVAHQGCAAINITASHNPPGDNGFKVRDRYGGAIDPEGLRAIENFIPDHAEDVRSMSMDKALSQNHAERFDPIPDYVAQIDRLIDLGPLRDAGLKILVDPMWGNGAGWFPRLLQGGSTRVIEIHNEHNPLFPQMRRPEPIPPNIDTGLQAIQELQADVLLTNDGDADRIGIGDEHGQFVDQLRVYALLAYYMLEVRKLRGPIVKTFSTTSMLFQLGEMYDVPVYETGVGFKYVAPKMLEVDAMIGGEESGGYAFRNHVPERDGILAGLYLLDMMLQLKRKPSELVELLFEKVGPHFYHRIDTPLPPDGSETSRANIEKAKPSTIGGLRVMGIDKLDGYKFLLEDGGWLLIRFSGTEPLVRAYCETTRADFVQPILQDGLRIIGIQ